MTELTYDLAFEMRQGGTGKSVPAIVLIVHRDAFVHLCATLPIRAEKIKGPLASARFLNRSRHIAFQPYTNGTVGYRACCVVEESNESVRLIFELKARTKRETAATLSLVFDALFSRESVNEDQYLVVSTHVTEREYHGHAISGWVSARFGGWLLKQAIGSHDVIGAHVVSAMRSVWRSVATGELKKYGVECGFHLSSDGRFLLGCFGNACDVAIYPEGCIGTMGEYPAQFDSHNLDMVEQQLTLLTGLVVLSALARQEGK